MTEGKTVPDTERIATTFKQLATASTHLNSAANDFNKVISILDDALSSLNLGVSAWHTVAGNEEKDGTFWRRDIGYARVRNKWGIALRKAWGNEDYDHFEEEEWRFADAPRWMCIESIAKLPDLIDDLLKRTQDATEKIKAKTLQAQDLAKAINAAASDMRQKAGKKR